MAFLKRADAHVVAPVRQLSDWQKIRTASQKSGAVLTQNNELLSKFNPKDFLISHCTIVSSVDTLPNPVNDKGWEYHLVPETQKFINNNNDCWERDLLKQCFRTFIGSENYVEHIQIPELSKGKIIDAVARDLGDSIYIDICVATSRKHKELIEKIASGETNALSMGCTVAFSICTKCGTVAADETELCPCVKYEKGNSFLDENGVRRIIAELCGHKTRPDSVKFVEASWVKRPAFPGAVVRNILTDESSILARLASREISFESMFEPKIAESLAQQGITPQDIGKAFSLVASFQKIASQMKSAGGDQPTDEELLAQIDSTDSAPSAPTEAPGASDSTTTNEEKPKDPEAAFSEMKDKLRSKLLEEVSKEVEGLVSQNQKTSPTGTEDLNERLFHSFDSVAKLHFGLAAIANDKSIKVAAARAILAYDRVRLNSALPTIIYEVLASLTNQQLADKKIVLSAVHQKYAQPITPREFARIMQRAKILREL